MTSEPVCVRHAGTVEEADLIVAWLAEHDIEAAAVGRDSAYTFGLPEADGVAICVANEETAERAKALLAEHDHAHDDSDDADAEFVEVLCEECGELNSFSDDLGGTVQGCAGCGAYLDVGVPDD